MFHQIYVIWGIWVESTRCIAQFYNLGVGNPTEVWIIHSTLQQHKITMNHKPTSYIHFFMVSTMSLPPPQKTTDVLPLLNIEISGGETPPSTWTDCACNPSWKGGQRAIPSILTKPGNPLEKFSTKKKRWPDLKWRLPIANVAVFWQERTFL